MAPGHHGVIEPEPRQAQIQRPPGRDEPGAEAQEVADEEKKADAGMQGDIAEQRGGGRTERMLGRTRDDTADERHGRDDGDEKRQHGEADPAARRAAGGE